MELVNTVIVTGNVYCTPVPPGPGLFRMTVVADGGSQIVTVEMDHRTSRVVHAELPKGTEVQVIGQLVTRRVEHPKGGKRTVTRILATYVGVGIGEALTHIVRTGHNRGRRC